MGCGASSAAPTPAPTPAPTCSTQKVGAPLSLEDLPYTIDENASKFAHLLDVNYADGTYREVFVKMRRATRKLVGTLVDEFVRLLEVNDPKSVRKAAAIKHICRSFISPDDAVDFDSLDDPETYLEETVLNAIRIFGEEKHSVGYNWKTGSIQDQDLVLSILEQPTKEAKTERMLQWSGEGKHGRYQTVFNLFFEQVQKEAGVSAVIPAGAGPKTGRMVEIARKDMQGQDMKDFACDTLEDARLAAARELEGKDSNWFCVWHSEKQRMWIKTGANSHSPYEGTHDSDNWPCTLWMTSCPDGCWELLPNEAGVSVTVPVVQLAYKPIQSLFNKMYVRRGQMGMNLIGDLQRGTMYVNTPEELDQIKQALKRQYCANLDRKIECIGDLASMLKAIRACDPMNLTMASGEAVNVIIYRVKDNSSQQERTDRGELSHVMNINFFIDGPQADCSRTATIIGACELQVGVLSTLNALRGNHLPYERQRILDGIPQLKHKLDSKQPIKEENDYHLVNQLFGEYHAVKTSKSITLTQSDGKGHAGSGYREGCEPQLYCVNHGRINHWRRDGYHVMQIWECDVDPSAHYVVESLAVKIRDQGWGNTGVNIAFFAVIGEDYMMEIASRALYNGDRKLESLDLVSEGFNFSRFMFASFLPRGTSRVVLVAMGRLKDSGHTFHYSGHSLKLGVLA